MTIFQLVGLRSSGTCQQLITQTDAHAGTYRLVVQKRTDMFYCPFASLWVARTIGQKQTVELQQVKVIVPWNPDDLYTSIH